MTIYAIVNEILQGAPGVEETEPVWALMSAASILQGGNPYFVPDFASRFEARTALALRIGKLGKGIARRFAYRYVDAIAPATVFAAADMLDHLMERGLPWTPAISYDRSLALGKFRATGADGVAGCECTLLLESSEESLRIPFSGATSPGADLTIEAISRDNTLKTGDIILIGLSGEGPQAKPGLKATLLLDGEERLRFNIR